MVSLPSSDFPIGLTRTPNSDNSGWEGKRVGGSMYTVNPSFPKPFRFGKTRSYEGTFSTRILFTKTILSLSFTTHRLWVPSNGQDCLQQVSSSRLSFSCLCRTPVVSWHSHLVTRHPDIRSRNLGRTLWTEEGYLWTLVGEERSQRVPCQ